MKYIILGQSVTAIKFVEKLRSYDNDAEIVVVGFDEHLPACPERFPELIARQITRKDALYHEENFYRNLRIEFISNKKINRINFKKRTIFFDDKSRLEGDVIIIADAEKDQLPDIKGTSKEGVYSLRSYKQANDLLDMISRIDTIVVESETLRGILLVQSLVMQDKEVILCIPSGQIKSDAVDQRVSDFLIGLLQNLGVRVIRNAIISEVLGETDVKAVRLSAGKVIAAEIVIFPDVLPDMRLYAKSDLNADQQILTDPLLCTNCEGIFAIDDMATGLSRDMKQCDSQRYRDDQVARLVAAVKNEECEAPTGVSIFSFGMSGHEIRSIGNLNGADAEIFVKWDEGNFLQKRIFVKNSVVRGAFLVDNTDIAGDLSLAIQEQQTINPDDSRFVFDCVKEGGDQDPAQAFEEKEVAQDIGECELVEPEIAGAEGVEAEPPH